MSEYLASDDDGARSSTSSFIAEEEEEEDEDSDDVSGSKEDASDEDDYGGDERPKARRQNNKGKAKASNGSAKRDRSSRSGPPDPSSVRRNDQIAQLPFRRFAAGTPSSNPAVKAPRAPAEKMQHRTDDFLFRPLSAFAPPGSPDERNDRAREDMMQQTIEAWCSRAFSPSLGDLKRMSALRLSSENPAPVRPWKRARVELPGAARQVSFFPQVTTFESEPERYNRALGPLDSLLLSGCCHSLRRFSLTFYVTRRAIFGALRPAVQRRITRFKSVMATWPRRKRCRFRLTLPTEELTSERQKCHILQLAHLEETSGSSKLNRRTASLFNFGRLTCRAARANNQLCHFVSSRRPSEAFSTLRGGHSPFRIIVRSKAQPTAWLCSLKMVLLHSWHCISDKATTW